MTRPTARTDRTDLGRVCPVASLVPFVKPPLTADQVTLLKSDNIVSDAAKSEGRTIGAFGIEPTSVEAILPSYIVRYRPQGQFSRGLA